MRRHQKKKVSTRDYRRTTCRMCASSKLYPFLSLGSMPIPNGFLEKSDLKKEELHYPLKVCVCESCWLVQLTHTIPAEIMFKNYLYVPSVSKTMVDHFQKMAADIISTMNPRKNDLVIDIGSNDGTLLSFFKKKHLNVLGIDPAENLAKESNKRGIKTIPGYFNEDMAVMVREKYGLAKVITATNVVAHIDDLHSVMKGIKKLLHPVGLFVMEAPYLIDLLDNNEFDTIYHEHLSYISIRPLMKLFEKYNLKIVDIKKQSVHGGTVRIFTAHVDSEYKIHPRVEKFVSEENLKKLHLRSTYDEFARRVKVIRRDLLHFLKRIKKEGRSIIGYGASAKGNVLTNYCNISTDILDYIVDSTPYKQEKYTPGTHIPIYSETEVITNTADYALLLSWNFAKEIIEKNKEFRERGGQFIITIPYLKII